MKVYLKNPPLSHAMERVTTALIQYSGGFRIVDDMDSADLVVIHTIGFPETETLVQQLRARRQKYVIIQYCLRTTQRPSTIDWLDIWKGAEFVWTYYDLEQLFLEDQLGQGGPAILKTLADYGIRIYRSPLGVDASNFRPWDVVKKYLIGTSGYVAESEGVLEANSAVLALGGQQFHLGPKDDRLENVWYQSGIPDKVLAQLYSQCNYVAGLRRGEGFELPAAEAILCGVRPVCFDRPHYRDWYKDWAVYIPEGSPEEVTRSLTELLATSPTPITPEEREAAVRLFNWATICHGFWSMLQQPSVPVKTSKSKRVLLWVGDAAVSTGFARSTHGILDTLKDHWEVHVLGLNYYGDPHPFPYSIYPTRTATMPFADAFGTVRLPKLITKLKPEVVVLQNDPWNIPEYKKGLGNVPAVGVIAVDGLNCRGTDLNGLKKAIFWTKFGETAAKNGGYAGPSAVIPLGVDLDLFRPMDRLEARRGLQFPEKLWDAFIFGNVNRNQPRKRMDLMISYFAEWLHTSKVNDAFLFLHVAPTGDAGYDVQQLAAYYGIANRLIVCEPDIGLGLPEELLVRTYNTFDVAVSTTQGEGMGLTTLEAMACGKPFIGPDWAALGDWAKKAMYPVRCTEIACTPNNVNAIGAIAGRAEYIQALDLLYRDASVRQDLSRRGLELSAESQYRWSNIGQRFQEELDTLFFTGSSVTVAGA
ncbi:MAG: glycosyltransferase [Desulfurellales bacterium]|nr:MAG: glycosyltransferase [Desulfurellales bacterium]